MSKSTTFAIIARFPDDKGVLTEPAIWLGAINESVEWLVNDWLENMDNFSIHFPVVCHILGIAVDGTTEIIPYPVDKQ